MEAEYIYIGLAAVFGIFMAWGIGANDVANAMATSVGSKALTIKQAILVAAIFEFLGAVLAGGEVTSTIRKGIVDADLLSRLTGITGLRHARCFTCGWFVAANRFEEMAGRFNNPYYCRSDRWFRCCWYWLRRRAMGHVGTIVISWVVSPLTAGFIAYLIYLSVQRLILSQDDPLARAKRYVPIYIFFAAFTITLVTILKGLKHVGLEISITNSYILATGMPL